MGLIPLMLLFLSCGESSVRQLTDTPEKHLASEKETNTAFQEINSEEKQSFDTTTFAAGCFWCVEEQFKQLNGGMKVVSGYTGGSVPNPTYQQVLTGTRNPVKSSMIQL